MKDMDRLPLNPGRPALILNQVSKYLLTAFLFILVIYVLSFAFHTGAGLIAEMVVSADVPEPVNIQ